MKVLFLDIDGVLNSNHWLSMQKGAWRDHSKMIDPSCVAQLNRVLEAVPGLQVVLSSSWRVIHALQEVDVMLRFKGFKGTLVDKTPPQRKMGHCRGHEIQEWLKKYGKDAIYAIVDDNSDMLDEQMDRFVQTSMQTGMTAEHADRLIALFS